MRSCVPSIFLNTASGLKHHLILKPEDYRNLSNECSQILVIYKVSPQNDVIIRQHTLTDSMQSILINFIAAIATSHGDTTPNLQLCASRCLFFFFYPDVLLLCLSGGLMAEGNACCLIINPRLKNLSHLLTDRKYLYQIVSWPCWLSKTSVIKKNKGCSVNILTSFFPPRKHCDCCLRVNIIP